MENYSKKSSIEDYLGITDNRDNNYKKEVRKEFKHFLKKHQNNLSEIEMGLTEDFGVYFYFDSVSIIEKGKFVSVYMEK